jgi:ATP-binding cassette subfamily F protein 3
MGSAVRSGRTVLHLSPLQVGYGPGTSNGRIDGGTLLVSTPELEVERGDRVALIGPNGSGKTTLLRSITGQLPTLKGRVEIGTNVKVGYYAQIHDTLDFDGTPFSIVLDAQPMSEEAARTYLGRFLFTEDDVFKRVASLSGGERSRLALAVLLLQQANFLVLDEPTNHLDINARETLEEMLAGFDGTILFVSHDRYFIDKIASRVWAISDGRIATYLGNYTDYQRALGHRPELKGGTGRDGGTEGRKDAGGAAVVAEGRGPAGWPSQPAPSDAGRQTPRLSEARLQKALIQAEREIARLEGKLNEISDALAVASIDADVAALSRLGREYERTQQELDAAYANWEELSDQLSAVVTPTASA